MAQSESRANDVHEGFESVDRLASEPDDCRPEMASVGLQFFELIGERPFEPVALPTTGKQRGIVELVIAENFSATVENLLVQHHRPVELHLLQSCEVKIAPYLARPDDVKQITDQ
jgi:hypothetical protein